jgi:hypothetical protein
MALTRSMVEPTTAGLVFIMEPIMVGLATTAILTEARPTGMMVPGMPMAREAAPPLGTMAPGALRDGGEAPLHGIMDRAALADSVVALLRGAAAPAAPPDGGVARPPGAAAPVRSTGLTGARARGDDDKTAAKRSFKNMKPTSIIIIAAALIIVESVKKSAH